MVLTFEPVMVKMTAGEIVTVFAVETGMIMCIIGMIAIVAVPRRISIIGVPRIFPF
jgi:hypothetical protein